MAIATLRLLSDARHGSSPAFQFLAVALPQSGMILDTAMDSEEDLTSTGINYQRWLLMFKQFPVTEAITIIDTATFAAAQALARQHMEASARFADLSITYGSITAVHRKIKILSPVLAEARIGAVSGSGVTGSPLASVRTKWQWKCTEAAQ